MTEGYNEYYLCGDKSLQSELRDELFKKMEFKVPPEHLRNRMLEIANILNVQDPYYVTVFTNNLNEIFDYRIELSTAFTKQHLFDIEEAGFSFENIIPRGETVVLYLKEKEIQ